MSERSQADTSGEPRAEAGGAAGPPRDLAELATYAVKSYRYLRLSIVLVLAALLVSVVLERAHTSCLEGSISDYFYTPTHSLFVSALVALGVSLISIRGNTDLEDALLNVAGVLAPIVAFVPTSLPDTQCTRAPLVVADTGPFIRNNVPAFGIALGVAMVIAVAFALRVGRRRATAITTPTSLVAIAVSVVLFAVGVIWYAWFRSSFLSHAHGGGAAALFFLIGVVVIINAVTTRKPRYRLMYWLVAAGMVAGFVGTAVFRAALEPNQVFWLELIELSLLIAFWLMQTVELWSPGVPTAAARTVPDATGPLRHVSNPKRADEAQVYEQHARRAGGR